MNQRYRIHITFSAGNLVKVASQLNAGLVVADFDASGTGQKAGAATGFPVYLPPTEGQDFNDLHRSMGTFRAAQALRKWMGSL
jgi:putative DNA primase/helicase